MLIASYTNHRTTGGWAGAGIPIDCNHRTTRGEAAASITIGGVRAKGAVIRNEAYPLREGARGRGRLGHIYGTA